MDYTAKFELVDKGTSVFSHEVMELVKSIDIEKSIGAAAKTQGISTAKAWKMIRGIEKVLGEAAIIKSRKGSAVDNYNVHISPACRGLLEKYANFEAKSEEAVQIIFAQYFG